MIDIDGQIEIAKNKLLTFDNLNTVGDLYLKKDDRQQAVAYFFEACDKLHFAQKEKKIAMYKKILTISPDSDRAYIGIIEILAKMGLAVEERKFLQLLSQLYKNRGDMTKAEELSARIKDLDSDAVSGGIFLRQETRKSVIELGDGRKEEAESASEAHAPDTEMDTEEEKLIEASLEEIHPEESYLATGSLKRRLLRWYLFGGGIVMSVVVLGVLLFLLGNRGQSLISLPVSSRINDYEISLSRLDDPAALTGVISTQDAAKADFFVLTVTNQNNCVPESFAAFPHSLISLLDNKGGLTRMRAVEGLQKTTRAISKMNVCGRTNAIVFVRTIIAVDRQNRYSGLAMSGLQNTGPIMIRWDIR